MFSWKQVQQKARDRVPDEYVEVTMHKDAFKFLEGLSKMSHLTDQTRKLIEEAVKYARVVDLPHVHMPWEWLEMEAERQGCDPVDILFDRAHAPDPVEKVWKPARSDSGSKTEA